MWNVLIVNMVIEYFKFNKYFSTKEIKLPFHVLWNVYTNPWNEFIIFPKSKIWVDGAHRTGGLFSSISLWMCLIRIVKMNQKSMTVLDCSNDEVICDFSQIVCVSILFNSLCQFGSKNVTKVSNYRMYLVRVIKMNQKYVTVLNCLNDEVTCAFSQIVYVCAQF